MRYLLVVLLLACASVGAQNINELPLFGETQKSPEAVAADQRFVDSAVKAAGSKESAARLATSRGWQHLKQGDTEVAIQSFNQAYLLQPSNVEVYWGLGVAMTQQGKYDLSVRMFGRALSIAPDNARLLADVGLAHTRAAVGSSQDPIEQAKRLQGAIPWFSAAQKLDPDYALTYANRAVTLYFLGNFTESWANIEKAEALDRASVDPNLIADLSKKLPRPAMSISSSAEDSATVRTESVPAPSEVLQSETPTMPRTSKVVMPKIPQGIPDEPAPKLQIEARPINVAPTKTAPMPVTPEAREPQVEDLSTPKKSLRIVSGQPMRPTGPDKRSCLNLPTNEAIMRCVYPRK